MTTTQRPPAHPALVVVAVLFVAVVVGVGATELFSHVVSRTVETSTVHRPTGDRFTVDSETGDVTVVPSTDGQVHVHTVVRHGIGTPDLVEESTPSGVRLDADCDDFGTSDCSVAYTVELPPAFALTVSGAHGDVTARGLTGPVRVDRSTGDIALFDVTGPVDVTSRAGEITALGLRGDTVQARSDTGDVRLELLEPPRSVVVGTEFGEVDVALPAGAAYRVSAWTRFGDRSVTVPVDPFSDRAVTIDGGTGDVRLHTT
ncbi:hypothetical protein BJF78_07820 [Pseudonocardia sp. CNS-139]|nr:hypothetical protein BJF78_07820 [Pseudonocardia sp. CNS-139]